MSEERPVETQPSFGQRLGQALLWLLRFIVRLLFVVLIGAALGVGIYFGFMALYQQYVAQLDTVQEAQSAQADLKAGLGGLQADVDALQADLQSMEEAQEAARVDLEVAQAALQGAQDLRQAEIDALQEAQDQLEADMVAMQADQKAMEQSLETLEAEVEAAAEALTEAVAGSEEKLAALGAELQGERSPAALYRELQVVRAMELVTRGRLFLAQNSLGQAQSDIEAGRDLLDALQSEVSLGQAVVLADIIALLDGALDNLPTAPVAAADELDGAWQLLLVGLPVEATALPTLAPTPGVTVTLTPTVTVTTTVTPTPTTSS
jgi:hypothetical protein